MLDFLGKIYQKKGGIWKYADFYAQKIEANSRLKLADGGTPLVENRDLNKKLSVGHLYFKREDRNETGSLKGRSLAYQVSLSKQHRQKALVISTSGNAGIAAAAYAQKAGLKLFIFIAPDTEKGKIACMQKYDPVIIKSRRAIRLANYAAARYKLPNLRPSVDSDSIEGFKSLAFELVDAKGAIDAVFMFVTSGSSFIGMYRGFEAYRQMGKINKMPKMYAVQSGAIFSIAEEFEENGCLIARKNPEDWGELKAGQLGIKNTQRKKEVLDIIQTTGGRGIYVGEKEVATAKKLLTDQGIETSLEGCASLAGFMRVQEKEKFDRAVCVLSGKLRSGSDKINESRIYKAESFEEVDGILESSLG